VVLSAVDRSCHVHKPSGAASEWAGFAWQVARFKRQPNQAVSQWQVFSSVFFLGKHYLNCETFWGKGDVVGEIGKQDILHVSLVLQAAGVDLDTAGKYHQYCWQNNKYILFVCTLFTGYANRNISKRNDGIVLLVFITYR